MSEIRGCREDDLAAVVDIARETLLEHVLSSGGDERFFTVDFLRGTLDSSTILVADVGGEVVGYLHVTQRARNERGGLG